MRKPLRQTGGGGEFWRNEWQKINLKIGYVLHGVS